MKQKMINLYCWALPLALLPMLDFSFNQIPIWLKGTEFRGIVSNVLTQMFAAIADAFILLFVDGLFGTQLGG